MSSANPVMEENIRLVEKRRNIMYKDLEPYETVLIDLLDYLRNILPYEEPPMSDEWVHAIKLPDNFKPEKIGRLFPTLNHLFDLEVTKEGDYNDYRRVYQIINHALPVYPYKINIISLRDYGDMNIMMSTIKQEYDEWEDLWRTSETERLNGGPSGVNNYSDDISYFDGDSERDDTPPDIAKTVSQLNREEELAQLVKPAKAKVPISFFPPPPKGQTRRKL